MFRKWKFIFLLMISVLALVACGKSLDEKATSGVEAAKEAFYSNDKNRTEEIDGIKLHKPAGFKIDEKSDAQNIVFTKNEETFILFINPNEKSDSNLFYDLLLADKSKEIIEQATFNDEGTFGFAAVVKSSNDDIELITSVGGSKMTTVTKKGNIEENLTRMMEIVRSIQRE
jgi:predicted Zn-dependent protease